MYGKCPSPVHDVDNYFSSQTGEGVSGSGSKYKCGERRVSSLHPAHSHNVLDSGRHRAQKRNSYRFTKHTTAVKQINYFQMHKMYHLFRDDRAARCMSARCYLTLPGPARCQTRDIRGTSPTDTSLRGRCL